MVIFHSFWYDQKVTITPGRRPAPPQLRGAEAAHAAAEWVGPEADSGPVLF